MKRYACKCPDTISITLCLAARTQNFGARTGGRPNDMCISGRMARLMTACLLTCRILLWRTPAQEGSITIRRMAMVRNSDTSRRMYPSSTVPIQVNRDGFAPGGQIRCAAAHCGAQKRGKSENLAEIAPVLAEFGGQVRPDGLRSSLKN